MSKENIEHPSHYNREGALECIDEMELVFGKEAVKHFCLLNAWKYRYRAADKNGIEDLKKSDWYLKKYREFEKTEVSSDKTTITFPSPTSPTITTPYYPPTPTPVWYDTSKNPWWKYENPWWWDKVTCNTSTTAKSE